MGVAVEAGLDEKTWFCVAAEEVGGLAVDGGWMLIGAKRSLTWFATTIAQSCSRARLRSRAPSFTSCADRVANAFALLEFPACSAR